MRLFAALLCVSIAGLTRGMAAGEEAARPVRARINAAGYYAREVTDREWHLRLVGEIQSLAGVYVIVHDASGKLIHGGPVSHGLYPESRPFEITVKPDGVTGDYKIIMVGHEHDRLGLPAPWTDLPFEVYGGGNFSIAQYTAPVYFKAPDGVTNMSLGAYCADLWVKDAEGRLVGDTRTFGKKKKYDNVVDFAVAPGAVYQMEKTSLYFNSYLPGTLFLSLTPSGCFVPSPELDRVKWWELIE